MKAREKRYLLRSLMTPGSKKFRRLRTQEARLLYVAFVLNADDTGQVDCDPDTVISLLPWQGWNRRAATRYTDDLLRVRLLEPIENDERKTDRPARARISGFSESQLQQVANATDCDQEMRPLRPHQSKGNHRDTEDGATSRNQSHDGRTNEVRLSATVPLLGNKDTSKETSKESAEDPVEAYRRARQRFRNYVGKSIGGISGKRYQWNLFVKSVGTEVAVLAVEIWSRELGKAGRALRYPLAVFLNQQEEYVEAARQEISGSGETEVEGEEEELTASRIRCEARHGLACGCWKKTVKTGSES